jgi:hypothetical protein
MQVTKRWTYGLHIRNPNESLSISKDAVVAMNDLVNGMEKEHKMVRLKLGVNAKAA